MSLEELLKKCEACTQAGLNRVQLVIQKGTSSRIKGFGRGELCCVNSEGSRVFWFDVKKVKATVENLLKISGSPESCVRCGNTKGVAINSKPSPFRTCKRVANTATHELFGGWDGN